MEVAWLAISHLFVPCKIESRIFYAICIRLYGIALQDLQSSRLLISFDWVMFCMAGSGFCCLDLWIHKHGHNICWFESTIFTAVNYELLDDGDGDRCISATRQWVVSLFQITSSQPFSPWFLIIKIVFRKFYLYTLMPLLPIPLIYAFWSAQVIDVFQPPCFVLVTQELVGKDGLR